MSRTARTVTALVALVALTACAGGRDAVTGPGPDGSSADGELSGDLTVFAAASLTDAFEDLAAELEAEHPDLTVALNLASSSTLATQLVEGAAADVFAAADAAQVERVVDEGLAGAPTTFATNSLIIAVEPGNPLDIAGLEDLARDDVVLVLPAPAVPAGRYAAEVLLTAGVEADPASLEVDVRATLAKVTLGEADAALVYASDVVSAGDAVDEVAIPAEWNVTATYPVVTLAGAPNPAAARAFVDLLVGDAGRATLLDAGFRPAPS